MPAPKVFKVRPALFLLALLGVAVLAAQPLLAGTDDREPVPPDRAVVYFINPWPHKGKNLVFIDTQAAGYVVDRSYFAVTLEPGSYLIWGNPTLAQWFEFKAGRAYVLSLDEAYTATVAPVMGGGAGFGSTFESGPTYSAPASWRVDDPQDIEGWILSRGLTHLTFNEADRARLAKKFSKRKFKRAEEEAGQPYPIELPDSFDNIGLREKRQSLMPRSLQNVKSTGRLTVDENRLRLVLGKKIVEIPIAEIRGVVGVRDEHLMRLEVLHGAPGYPDEIFFVTHSHAEHNRIVMSIFEAMDRRR